MYIVNLSVRCTIYVADIKIRKPKKEEIKLLIQYTFPVIFTSEILFQKTSCKAAVYKLKDVFNSCTLTAPNLAKNIVNIKLEFQRKLTAQEEELIINFMRKQFYDGYICEYFSNPCIKFDNLEEVYIQLDGEVSNG